MSGTRSPDRMALQRRITRVLSAFRTVAVHMASTRRDPDEAAMHLAGRIGAIGRAALADGYGLDLELLVLDELTAHAVKPNQYDIRGVDVQLDDGAAHLMSLVIHELATNAVKYGALTQPDARLRVLWWHTGGPESQRLHFEWSEEGMQLAEGEPRQIGFGSDVIQRLIARELHGMGELSFSSSGMHCVIEIPLAEAPYPDE
jgi:two-component system, chemotaxis family, CheB/CheR fusion protein